MGLERSHGPGTVAGLLPTVVNSCYSRLAADKRANHDVRSANR